MFYSSTWRLNSRTSDHELIITSHIKNIAKGKGGIAVALNECTVSFDIFFKILTHLFLGGGRTPFP